MLRVHRLAALSLLAICLASMPLRALAADHGGAGGSGVSASRPGLNTVSQNPPPVEVRSSAVHYGSPAPGEGAGRGFCAKNGGHALGASFESVWACGPSTGTADDFDTIGYQCVELSVRYLWVVYGHFLENVGDGRDVVAAASSDLSLPIGKPGPNSVPAVGDIVSMWGGPDADPDGHTAVVTSVTVDASGNGDVGVMEENGASNGWDQITVSNWKEVYGSPTWGGGYYYYNHVEWLELKPATPTLNGAPINFKVQGLGAGSVATSINDLGAVAGYVNHSQTSGGTWLQPFLFHDNQWTYPPVPAAATHIVGVNDRGAVAAWAPQRGTAPVSYAMHSASTTKWDVLPLPNAHVTADRTTSIDGNGDVSGWVSESASKAATAGVIWVRSGGTYAVRTLAPNKYFDDPVVYQADHAGGAVGSEMLGTTRTYAVVWAPWGAAYRLPGLSTVYVNSVARGMTAAVSDGLRTLTIVGGSVDDSGTMQAVKWTVTMGTNSVGASAPVALAGTASTGPSMAVAINRSGWIVGNLGSTGAFIWRPSFGFVDLQTLLPATSGWLVESVTGINGAGTVIGQGYSQTNLLAGSTRGIVLTPYPLTTS